MEPILKTEERLLSVLEELIKLEIFIHWPTLGPTKQELENILDENFWEVGASGKRYNRDIVLRVLEERTGKANPEVWINKDFHCAEISAGHYLLTYTLCQGERLTQRSSIWRKKGERFKLVYHQGTIVAKE